LVAVDIKELSDDLSEEDVLDHVKKYSWIAFGYDGPGWNAEDIKNRLSQLPSDVREIEKLIEEKENKEKDLILQQKEAVQDLGLSEDEEYLFHVLRTLGFWKFERKFQNQKAHIMMEDFIGEIARRNNLSIAQVKMIAPNEMEDVLVYNKVDAGLLDERIKESVFIFKGTEYEVLSGDAVKEVSKEIHDSLEVDTNVSELQGSTAYPGYAKGVVKQVDVPADMEKMEEGDILISTSTSPHILPAMKKAAAIVTDSGGITCHAAIVAREIKIPTVIGTKTVTKILKDGDLVEVNADKGTVKILEKKS